MSACVASCTTTVEKPVPVRPAPCLIAPFPVPPEVVHLEVCAGVTCLKPVAAAEMAAWENALADWRDSVLSCPAVKMMQPVQPTPVVDPQTHNDVPSILEAMGHDPQNSLW